MASAQGDDAGGPSRLNRVLAGATIGVVALSVGLGGGFVLAYQAPPPPPPTGEPAPATVEANGDCVMHLREADGSLWGDLANVALLDVARARELEVELADQRTIRFVCPEAPTSVDILARREDGQFHYQQDVAFDAARNYMEVELPAKATEPAAFLARRSEAGVEGAAPAWLGAEPGEAAATGEDAGEDAGEAPGEDTGEAPIDTEPAVAAEPAPFEGTLRSEVRDLVGETRSKDEIRDIAKRGGADIEGCVGLHAAGVQRARHHYQLYVTDSGAVAGMVWVQGVNPELDACVAKALEGWNFGATGEGSFFKLKVVWTP